MPLASGAGHDAAFVSRIAPSAMLFVPCKDGKSHAPEEWAEPDALAAGAAVMLEAVRRFDEKDRQVPARSPAAIKSLGRRLGPHIFPTLIADRS